MFRWFHLACALALVGWLYSPLIAHPFATTVVRFLLVPFLALTGLAMWSRLFSAPR